MKLIIHPGEVLDHEFMKPLEISAPTLASNMNVPAHQVTSLIDGTMNVGADIATGLSQTFGTTPEFWLNLQARFDVGSAKF